MREARRRQRALERVIAREMKAVRAEEKLADGLARGHYECGKCGEPRGWTMEGTKRSGKVATYMYCACGDGPNLGVDDPLSVMPGGAYGVIPYMGDG